jgi:hypothetical protein
MSRLKKFFILFLSFLPITAGAVAPLAIGAIGGGIAIAGFSIYRSMAPVNMADALSFFSSCWSCGMFNDVMLVLSDILPRVYSTIGAVCIPLVFALTAVYFAWDIIRGYIGLEDKQPDAWNLSGKFGAHMVKIALVVGLLAMPLPRFISSVAIEPIFNIGLSLSHIVDKQFTTGTENEYSFESCLVASAVMDPSSADKTAAASGAFSPKLRHNMACQVGGIHQMTGLGMTAGWTMMNMAFNDQYMHKLIFGIPIFPNMAIFLAGLLVTILFFFALLPVPLYFLQTFITLAMNLIMLPLMLLSWLFADWKILNLGATPKTIFDEVVRDTLGIAMLGIFTAFSVMFLNAAFGKWAGASALATALAQNDASILIDGMMMSNGSLVTIIMLGLFLAMFMNAIPALIQALFADVKIPNKLYDSAEKNIKQINKSVREWWKKISS